MSYVIDGKVANQKAEKTKYEVCRCGKCGIAILPPVKTVMQVSAKKCLFIYHYINSNSYIYETKSGKAVVYCSDQCRRNHNHRFRR